MKITSMVLAVALCAAIFVGCGPFPRLVYEQSQFSSRVEYLRFASITQCTTAAAIDKL